MTNKKNSNILTSNNGNSKKQHAEIFSLYFEVFNLAQCLFENSETVVRPTTLECMIRLDKSTRWAKMAQNIS